MILIIDDSTNLSTEYIAISIFLFFNCVIMYVAFIVNIDNNTSLQDSPIYDAFKVPTLIYFGITVNVATCIPTIMELFMDMDIKRFRDLNFQSNGKDINTWIESFFLAMLSLVPGFLVLLLRHNANIPYIYAAVHSIQGLGSICTVLLICKKQVPQYFSSTNVICAMFFFSSACICSMLGFGHDILYAPNVLTFVFLLPANYFLLWRLGFPWIKNLWVHSISKKKPISIADTCAMWYFMNTIIIIIFIHGIVSINKLFDWKNFDSLDIDVFVYSFALYSVVNSTVPGRLARIAVEKERNKMVETKRALIRYLSHEVRSPLNVIHSGLNLLVVDVEKLPPTDENENLQETISSIHHASSDLLQTMNDLLLLESMDSAAFAIQEKMVPCANLTQIAEKCGLLPREKGIVFNVSNQFESAQVHSEPATLDESSSAEQPDPMRDIELGTEHQATTVTASPPMVFIDEHKIGQVLRNLITNSAKFTPAGESIGVNIRPLTSADLPEANDSSSDGDSGEPVDSNARVKTFIQENGFVQCGQVLIEVVDSGAGIAPENWSKVFGQFVQFDASKLQVGGGGTTCVEMQ